LAIFWDVSPHFKSHNGEIWREGADLELPPPRQIFFKNRVYKAVYHFGANFYQKLHFGDFGSSIPKVLKQQQQSFA